MAIAESPAQARVLFREVNERIRSLHGPTSRPSDVVPGPFIRSPPPRLMILIPRCDCSKSARPCG